jgi:hypothetical protein
MVPDRVMVRDYVGHTDNGRNRGKHAYLVDYKDRPLLIDLCNHKKILIRSHNQYKIIMNDQRHTIPCGACRKSALPIAGLINARLIRDQITTALCAEAIDETGGNSMAYIWVGIF